MVETILKEKYNLLGRVSTVMEGINWTLAFDRAGLETKYVRLYRLLGRKPEDAYAELRILEAVVDTNALSVSRPIPNVGGDLITEVSMPDGVRRLMAVFGAAKGIEPRFRESDYYLIGEALKDLHAQAHLDQLAADRSIEVNLSKEALRVFEFSPPGALRELECRLSKLVDDGAHLRLGKWGLCHGDFGPINLRLSDGRATLFDFDECGRGPQLLDVAAIAFWLETCDQRDVHLLWRAFLEGYGSKLITENRLGISWLVAQHQMRILQSLQTYCALDKNTWEFVFSRALGVTNAAANERLKVFH